MAGGLRDWAIEAPERLAVSDGTRTYTRWELDDRVNRLVNHLHGSQLGPGDRVALIAQNCADYMTVAVGAGLAGISVVPVNTHLTPAETRYILESSQSRAVFVDDAAHELAEEVTATLGTGPPTTLRALDEILAHGDPAEPSPNPVSMPIYYTSGTTGRPKPTRQAEMSEGLSVAEAVRAAAAAGHDAATVHLTASPLYHAGPLTPALRTILTGGQLHVMPRFDAEEMLRLIEAHRVTSTLVVPSHCVRLLRLPAAVKERYDTSSLRAVLHIAAMMPPEVKEQMIDWWGPILDDAYGASEIGVISRITSEEWLERRGSVGRPVAPFTIDIVAPDGSLLPPGEIGQIYVDSHGAVDLVYLDDPEKTAASHRGPFQFTLGDIGHLDDDGYLYLADRREDLIVRGGVNVYPAEVEAALLEHPAVADVGVFAQADDDLGHAVVAAVEPMPGVTASAELGEEILAWARARLASFKVPRSLEFWDPLPRYDNGKLHRRELREGRQRG